MPINQSYKANGGNSVTLSVALDRSTRNKAPSFMSHQILGSVGTIKQDKFFTGNQLVGLAEFASGRSPPVLLLVRKSFLVNAVIRYLTLTVHHIMPSNSGCCRQHLRRL